MPVPGIEAELEYGVTVLDKTAAIPVAKCQEVPVEEMDIALKPVPPGSVMFHEGVGVGVSDGAVLSPVEYIIVELRRTVLTAVDPVPGTAVELEEAIGILDEATVGPFVYMVVELTDRVEIILAPKLIGELELAKAVSIPEDGVVTSADETTVKLVEGVGLKVEAVTSAMLEFVGRIGLLSDAMTLVNSGMVVFPDGIVTTLDSVSALEFAARTEMLSAAVLPVEREIVKFVAGVEIQLDSVAILDPELPEVAEIARDGVTPVDRGTVMITRDIAVAVDKGSAGILEAVPNIMLEFVGGGTT